MTPQQAPRVPFQTGTTIGGKYRIVSLIGVGGVGRVYLAKHIELDTDVAIKVLRPEMMERPDVVHRFAREARASVRLRSERIARVFDVGTHDGTPYFVMEYMVGCDLLQLRQDESVDITTLCEFFIQACEGLADAHAQGVVHRDIKPDNLFVVRDANGWRSLKIFDFGISKFSLSGKHSDVDLASMMTEAMMGTPHYISPEQIRATRDVDHRTDIWSLGAVMFEVLSKGILPFREEREFTALIAEVLERPHRSLLDVAPNIPERLAEIVDMCLTKDRDLRYQTAAEVAMALLPLAPARARASAERAVGAMQAAGLMAINADIEAARTSQPPPAEPVRSVIVTPPPASLRVTAPSLRTASAQRAAVSAPTPTPAPARAADEPSGDPFRPRRRGLLFAAMALLGLIGLVAFITPWGNEAPAPSAGPPPQKTILAATPPVANPAPARPALPSAEPAQAAATALSAPTQAQSLGLVAKRPGAAGSPAALAVRPAVAAARPAFVAPKVSATPKAVDSPSPPKKPDLRRER